MSTKAPFEDTIVIDTVIVNKRHIQMIVREGKVYKVHTQGFTASCDGGSSGCKDVEELWNTRYAQYLKRHGLSTGGQ